MVKNHILNGIFLLILAVENGSFSENSIGRTFFDFLISRGTMQHKRAAALIAPWLFVPYYETETECSLT